MQYRLCFNESINTQYYENFISSSGLLFFGITINLQAQNDAGIQLRLGSAVKSEEFKTVLLFQGIDYERIAFSGNVKGKNYKISVHEYEGGEFKNEQTLFNSTQSEYFKIKSDSINLEFLSQIMENEIELQFKGPGYFTRKLRVPVHKKHGEFALKDFLGLSNTTAINSGDRYYLYSIITPSVNEDGSILL